MKFKIFSPIFAILTLGFVVGADPAKASYYYNIYESSGKVVIETEGSLNALPAPAGVNYSCGALGLFAPPGAGICTGANTSNSYYSITGPSAFTAGITNFPASSVSGIATTLTGKPSLTGPGRFSIADSYVLGTPIISSATFNGMTLASFGLTPSSGSLGTWTINGTSETINVRVTPGPLPLLGAGAAFGFSRRLRRRIQQSQVVSDS